MSASKNTPGRVAAALTGVLGMSAVAGVLVAAMVTPAIAVTSLAANNTIGLFEDLPDYLQIDNLAQKTELYATQGGQPVKFAEFYAQNRQEVSWDEVSDNAKAAAVDTEDPRFYEHGGVDVQSTFRALAQNVIGGGVESGASTITMQYVKNVLVQKAETLAETDPDAGKKAYAEATQESTARKLKEMRLAIGLEKKFSKNDILLGYLNIANYGGSVYGIQSAAKYYYGVDAKDLSIAQAASLVATVNYPTALRIDEPGNIKANQERRDVLIDNMLKHHSITQEQHDEAIATAVTPAITPSVSGCNAAQPASAAYFCDAVKYTVENSKEFGANPDEARRNLNRNGYKIYTTLNLDLQAKATDDMRKQIPTTMNSINVGSAMTSVEAKTGRVIAMVQNTDYGNGDQRGVTSVNYNTDQNYGGSGGFQVGSTYKLVTLLEWLKEGHSVNEVVNSSKGTWSGRDFQDSCTGGNLGSDVLKVTNDGAAPGPNRTVMSGTANSTNTAFMAMASELDMCGIGQTAKDIGIHQAVPGKPLSNYVSDIIGSGGNNIAPLTMAQAYATVANNGTTCDSIMIDKVVLPDDTEIAPPSANCRETVSQDVAHTAAYALAGVMGATGAAANTNDGTPLIGKTGTTDKAKDTWFVGSSTEVTTAIWVGSASGQQIQQRITKLPSGQLMSTARFAVWKPFMQAVNAVYKGSAFPGPAADLTRTPTVQVPDVSGMSPADAQSAIEGAGLTFAQGGARSSANVPAGQVAGSDPGAGANAARGSTVTVFISSGPDQSQQQGTPGTVPNVQGQDMTGARQTLRSAGFDVTMAQEQVQDNSQIGKATRTDPAAGQQSSGPVTLYIGRS
ncbi:transglycosylase domain-containing protein [Clavibacter michiganensis]|uniref:transglycosylase domain-containing protein n=1 Tax=Clavibacter michiganensis TaxID=28447 RepID=UPI000A3B26CE|nr:transglycosylase domain-containing protein [Clavibacter michiganensis]KAF0258223.1 Penicillin-binding protein 1F [Clavibacter michiganensis subsp. michiganensis]MBE3078689.1 PASTA domain-containing protein [Clavibacter michiganensis subsp. michiganensis]MBW8025473.1 PASTA domain-containing protein [Clavibacter michiganensis subsp. michiganensis]MDO4019593.1 transglycosylase domain-containing protein [Clavibacter michiganensis]MDO4030182.1 transglycosylase domain-containing protein [Clavibac